MFFNKKKKVIDNNIIYVGDTPVCQPIKNLHINITGNNNIIRIDKNTKFQIFCAIQIKGDYNEIVIQNTKVDKFNIFIKGSNCKLIWGAGTTSTDANIVMGESNQSLTIGKDCMLSNADIRVSDGHTIYDIKTKKILNKGAKDMVIGDHCWICQGCLLTKNARLGNNIIVGAHSVVSKAFMTPNVIIAGQPAKIIKTDVCFSRINPSAFGEYFDPKVEYKKLLELGLVS